MESNKEEAEHCIALAEKYIKENHPGKARKFLKKSLHLFPTQKGQDLLQSIKDTPSHEPSIPFKSTPKCVELSKNNTSDHRSQSPSALDNMIHQICNSRDYYDILGVKSDASEKELKKSYKKLALQLHPDKTKRPGAADAFKAIRNAVATLTDPTKRRFYDIYGPAEMNSSWSFCSFRTNMSADHNNSTESESEPIMCEGVKASHHGKSSKHDSFSLVLLKNILPILFVIIITLISTFLMYDPTYSLQRTTKYPVPRYTHNLKVPYYVKPNFLSENSGLTITQLDNEVEIDTITNLQYACYSERNYRNSMLQSARDKQDSKLLRLFMNMRLPSCENLYELQRSQYI